MKVSDLERLAGWYEEASPAVIRCGWGVERNRNGGSAVAAILALPAVAGKFGVPGGGYTLSNTGAWKFSPETVAGIEDLYHWRLCPTSRQFGKDWNERIYSPSFSTRCTRIRHAMQIFCYRQRPFWNITIWLVVTEPC